MSKAAPAAPAKAPAQKKHVSEMIRDTLKADDKDHSDDENDLKVAPDGSMEGSAEEVGKALKEKEASARAARRAKLAEKAMQFADVLTKAHGTSGHVVDLDTKPTGDLAKVETLQETHSKMLDVAKAPPQVRKMAEDIQRHVVAGHIDPSKDFDGLIAVGLDSAAVAYWKKFYGQAESGSQFASELVKEHTKAKVAEEQTAYRAKLARAYALANEMADSGYISKDASSINTQVSSLMEFNDAAFDSMKTLIARQPVVKKASIPAVGMIDRDELPAPPAASTDIKSAFDRYFAGKKF